MTKKMNFNSSLLGLLFLFSTASLLAQNKYSLETELSATGGIQEELPFWLYHNTRGRVGAQTNLLGLVAGRFQHEFRNGSLLQAGAGLLLRDNAAEEDYLDEAYLSYFFDKFYITAGRKQRKEYYNGLSATNENILWSLNARPLPGFSFGTTAPVMLLHTLGLEAKWEEFLMEKDRHVPWARLHHKSLHLIIRPDREWEIKIGLQHFAQWGGVSPEWGPQPEGLSDYLRVITGREGNENAIDADRKNVLGSHLGSYEVEVKNKNEIYNLVFRYNSIFEDGSGSRMDNFPDGLYTFYIEGTKSQKLVTSFLYEFYYMLDHSGTGPHPYDDYLNNWPTYNSGWSYYKNIIGSPFFTYDLVREKVINNKYIAHHLGITGNFITDYDLYPFKLLISYAHNEGTYGWPLKPKHEDAVYTYFNSRLYNSVYNDLQINLQVGADFSSLKAPNFGAGISLKYHFSGQ